jgi:hypothetical protein
VTPRSLSECCFAKWSPIAVSTIWNNWFQSEMPSKYGRYAYNIVVEKSKTQGLP